MLAHRPSKCAIKADGPRDGALATQLRYIEQLVVGTSPENLGAGNIKMTTGCASFQLHVASL